MRKRFAVALAGVLLSAMLASSPAEATSTGHILFERAKPLSSPYVGWNTRLMTALPGGTGRSLVSVDPLAGGYRYSPDGSKLTYTRQADASFRARSQIWVMNADGTGAQQLTPLTRKSDFSPAWSPDGTQIVYDRANVHRWPTNFYPQLYVMNADGTNRHPLTNGGTVAFEDPDWSPDGTKILATQSDGQTQPQLVTIDPANGQVLATLTTGPMWHWNGRWSPDGTQIVMTQAYDAGIAVMNADGSGLTTLTTPPLRKQSDWAPEWSPDGSQIAFERTITNLRCCGSTVIWVMNADGTSQSHVLGDPPTYSAFLEDWGP